jgi:hypothetical protein
MLLADFKRRSVEEVTSEFNQRFPPSRFWPFPVQQSDIQGVLDYLVTEMLVATDILSFTNRPLVKPTIHYGITGAGFQERSRPIK